MGYGKAIECTAKGRSVSSGFVSAATIAPDGKRSVSSAADGKVKLWDHSTYQVIQTNRDHKDLVYLFSSTLWTFVHVIGGAGFYNNVREMSIPGFFVVPLGLYSPVPWHSLFRAYPLNSITAWLSGIL